VAKIVLCYRMTWNLVVIPTPARGVNLPPQAAIINGCKKVSFIIIQKQSNFVTIYMKSCSHKPNKCNESTLILILDSEQSNKQHFRERL